MNLGQSKSNPANEPETLTDGNMKKYLKDVKLKHDVLIKYDTLLKDFSDFNITTYHLDPEEDTCTKYDLFMASDICIKCLIPKMINLAEDFIDSSDKPNGRKLITKWKKFTKVIDKTIENYTNLRSGKDLVPIPLDKVRCDIDYTKLLKPLGEISMKLHI